MHHNLKKASKSDLKSELQTQLEVQSLMTVLMQHIDNPNKSVEEKLATIGQFALSWYDMSTYAVNDCTNELNRRKEEV